jgi:hypothetical protein
MLAWIRENDNTSHGMLTYTADFLLSNHMSGRIESLDIFYMLKDIMITILQAAEYAPGE